MKNIRHLICGGVFVVPYLDTDGENIVVSVKVALLQDFVDLLHLRSCRLVPDKVVERCRFDLIEFHALPILHEVGVFEATALRGLDDSKFNPSRFDLDPVYLTVMPGHVNSFL